MLNRRDFLKLLGPGAVAVAVQTIDSKGMAAGFRPIELFETWIAGFRFHAGMKEEVLSRLQAGEDLRLEREPENPYDPLAIAVYTQAGQRIGYLPRTGNEIPAAIADQGVHLTARIVAILPDNPTWERVRIRVIQWV